MFLWRRVASPELLMQFVGRATRDVLATSYGQERGGATKQRNRILFGPKCEKHLLGGEKLGRQPTLKTETELFFFEARLRVPVPVSMKLSGKHYIDSANELPT